MRPRTFKEINFPIPAKVDKHGDMHPLSFYGQVIPRSKKIQFKLGYFSTNAISTLAAGFAQFIYNNGSAEFIINQFISEKDYELLRADKSLNEIQIKLIESNYISDLEELHNVLKETKTHFFNCLKYLLKVERLKIIPVTCSDGEMSHFKEAIFTDAEDNKLYINGSCNFTQSGIIDNGESFVVNRSWKNQDDKILIEYEEKNFARIISKQATKDFIYLDPLQLEKVIYSEGLNKELKELLEDEETLRKRLLKRNRIQIEQQKIEQDLINEINNIKSSPRFPFGSGAREYQQIAYERWTSNGYKGLFAMATGTGKTITALNCILEEWKINRYYRTIILVPTKALASQWKQEALGKFNFTNTINTGDDDWRKETDNLIGCAKSRLDVNFILITTYSLFKRRTFQEFLNKITFFIDTVTLIADEAHTLGSPGGVTKLPISINKRIGLSATPGRQYDAIGTRSLNDYFQAGPPRYTIVYTMKKAIDDEILCPFNYYPRFCSLKDNELDEYLKITKQLTKYLDSKTGKYKDLPEVTNLLILRKHIIHKAQEKLEVFDKIMSSEIGILNVAYMFVYVPEGYEPKYWETDLTNNDFDDDNDRLINNFSKLMGQKGIPVIKFESDTENKELILSQFAKGKYKALIAMKCLDEGIDIPRAEYAIFCSSTGNPRQFIQRRGRVLRKYEDKTAKIYDIIIHPDFEKFIELTPAQIQAEKNIFKSELFRIINFTAIAENRMDVIEGELGEICSALEIDNLLELINIEYNNQNIEL